MEARELGKDREAEPQSRVGYLKWGAVCLFVLLFCFFVSERPYKEGSAREVIGALANCFTVPGVILSGIGGISYIAYHGGYDALGYAFSRFGFHNVFPSGTKKKYDTLHEFKRKKEKRRKKPLGCALAVGLISLTAGAALSAVYLII